MHHLVTQAAVFAASQGSSPSFLNGNNLRGLIVFVAGLAIAVVGLAMVGKSHKGRLKDQAERGGNVLLAVVVIALGLGGMFMGFGDKFLSFFLG